MKLSSTFTALLLGFTAKADASIPGVRGVAMEGSPCEFDALTDEDTCGEGFICMVEDGACNSQSGTCQADVDLSKGVCRSNWRPVCGCDGKTYSNKCRAKVAGAGVSHKGECDASSSPEVMVTIEEGSPCEFDALTDEDTCSEGYICVVNDGECNSQSGTCQADFHLSQPVCKSNWRPVCGCDGITYSNKCKAKVAGAGVSHKGACDVASISDSTSEVVVD